MVKSPLPGAPLFSDKSVLLKLMQNCSCNTELYYKTVLQNALKLWRNLLIEKRGIELCYLVEGSC